MTTRTRHGSETAAERRARHVYEDNAGDLNSDFRHSTYYHSYFAGYAERRTQKGAKAKIERVYVGNYYRLDLPARKRGLFRFSRPLLLAVSAGLFLLSSAQSIPGNLTLYFSLFCALAAILLLPAAVVSLLYLAQPKRMTKHEYSSSHESMSRFGLALLCLQALCAVSQIIGTFLAGNGWSLPVIETILCMAAAAAVMLLLWLSENRAPYAVEENTKEAPEDSSVIG